MTPRVDTLIGSVCGPAHPLAPSLRRWCLNSRAFLAFAEKNETKLRKKVRQAAEAGAASDLLAEWAVAAWLLPDRRFGVQYEPRRADGGRSADFGVTFRTTTPFQVEVTRLRPGGSTLEVKLARVLADKVGQLASGTANLLVVILPHDEGTPALVNGALKLLNGADFTPELCREFQRGRSRLSAVLLAGIDDLADLHPLHLWVNTQAKHLLPADLARFLQP